jgi:hypothetical protein
MIESIKDSKPNLKIRIYKTVSISGDLAFDSKVLLIYYRCAGMME